MLIFIIKISLQQWCPIKSFLLLFPEDAQIDYVTYKIGMSYWNESSNHPDQAQQFTEKKLKNMGSTEKESS